MSLYRTALTEVFPTNVTTEPDRVRIFVEKLLDSDRAEPIGSSFAVTVDTHPNWTLWLSQASFDYLCTQYPDWMVLRQDATTDN